MNHHWTLSWKWSASFSNKSTLTAEPLVKSLVGRTYAVFVVLLVFCSCVLLWWCVLSLILFSGSSGCVSHLRMEICRPGAIISFSSLCFFFFFFFTPFLFETTRWQRDLSLSEDGSAEWSPKRQWHWLGQNCKLHPLLSSPLPETFRPPTSPATTPLCPLELLPARGQCSPVSGTPRRAATDAGSLLHQPSFHKWRPRPSPLISVTNPLLRKESLQSPHCTRLAR